MKKLTLLLLFVTVALGAVAVVQWRKIAAERLQVTALHNELQQTSQQLEEAQAAQKQADEQRREASRQAQELTAQLQAKVMAASNPPVKVTPVAMAAAPTTSAVSKAGEKGGLGNMISKMMQDPDMKKFIVQQQKATMEQLYSPLFKQLSLTPEETTQFKDMLGDHMAKVMDNAGSLFTGTNNTEMAAKLSGQQKEFDAQIKDFLGEDRFSQYQAYQETSGERAMLNLYKQQNPGEYSLNDAQTEQLLKIMSEEKKSVAQSTGLPLRSGSGDEANIQAMLSPDQAEKLLAAQETVNQRVYDRSRTVLSPDQLQSLSKFQTNQLQLMRMSMGMMRSMFGSEGGANTTPSPTPTGQ